MGALGIMCETARDVFFAVKLDQQTDLCILSSLALPPSMSEVYYTSKCPVAGSACMHNDNLTKPRENGNFTNGQIPLANHLHRNLLPWDGRKALRCPDFSRIQLAHAVSTHGVLLKIRRRSYTNLEVGQRKGALACCTKQGKDEALLQKELEVHYNIF